MTNNPHGPPVYRLARLGRSIKPEAGIAQQHQIRATAPSSPAYGTVKASMDAWNGSTDAYATLQDLRLRALQGLHDVETRLRAAEQQFSRDERTVHSAVVMVAGGQSLVIISLGFQAITGQAPRAGAPSMPTNLVGKPGVDPGAVHFSWKSPAAGASFPLQLSTDPVTATSWSSLSSVTRRSVRIGDLRPGQLYWLRAAVVTAGGQSAWTDPVSVRVP